MATTRLLSAMVATWNNVATTFTGLKLNVTDTASAVGSMLLELQVNSSPKFGVNKFGGINVYGNLALLSNAGSVFFGSGLDLVITRDAANTLALRNSTAAQSFNVYNTYTDASNFERAAFGWSGNILLIGTGSSGTGTQRQMDFMTAGTTRWTVANTGHFIAGTDNTYDIGASGANRPRNLYIAGNCISGGSLYITSSGLLNWGSKGSIAQTSDGAYTFGNNAATNVITMTAGSSGLATFGGSIVSGGDVQAVSAGGFSWLGGKGGITQATDGVFTLNNNAGTNPVSLTVGAANLLTLNGGLKTTGATFALQTATTLTDNAAAQVATMTNGPTAGNPTKWIAINDNGVTRYIPCW